MLIKQNPKKSSKFFDSSKFINYFYLLLRQIWCGFRKPIARTAVFSQIDLFTTIKGLFTNFNFKNKNYFLTVMIVKNHKNFRHLSHITSEFIPSKYCLNMYCISFRQGFSNFSSKTLTFKLFSRLLIKQFSNTLKK
jgi:hypothetical protein